VRQALTSLNFKKTKNFPTCSQPSTLFGVPLWKMVGLAGTASAIYMKVHGYEFRDLVYVSKKHFDTATTAIKQQYEQVF
jgi:hypothetical protein